MVAPHDTSRLIKGQTARNFLRRIKPHESKNALDPRLPQLYNVVMTTKYEDDPTRRISPRNPNQKRLLEPYYVCSTLPFAELSSNRFLSVILRYGKQWVQTIATVALFGSGAGNSVGAASEYKALLVHVITRLVLESLGYPLRIINIQIHNKVFSGQLPHGIDIKAFGKETTSVSCEKSFPGTIYVEVYQGYIVVVMVFGTGKLVMMGIRYLGSQNEIFQHLAKVLAPYATHNAGSRAAQQGQISSMTRIVGQVFSELTPEEQSLPRDKLSQLIVQRINERATAEALDPTSRQPKRRRQKATTTARKTTLVAEKPPLRKTVKKPAAPRKTAPKIVRK